MLNISRERAIKIYADMLLSRSFEEKCVQAYGRGLIVGFCHLYIGQEAISVALYHAKKKTDDVITSYRCHVQALLAGESPEAVFGELMGMEIGSSKGKGGSMHIFSPENNFWGGHGIVGAPASLGTGIAFANKYKKTSDICIAMYGDGACDQGQVYESYNMASLWNLPILFVIENNFYSMGTACGRHSSLNSKFHLASQAFNIKSKLVDGMSFEACYNAFSEGIEYVRKHSRPFVLQVDCYRFRGHSMSDAGTSYRSKEEIDQYKNLDPIIFFRDKFLKAQHNISIDDIDKIDDEISTRIDRAFEVAKSSNLTSMSELFTDLY